MWTYISMLTTGYYPLISFLRAVTLFVYTSWQLQLFHRNPSETETQ